MLPVIQTMRQINISEFRSNLLQHLRDAQRGEQINITSKGALLATVMPPVDRREAARAGLRKLADTAVVRDVLSPAEGDWEMME